VTSVAALGAVRIFDLEIARLEYSSIFQAGHAVLLVLVVMRRATDGATLSVIAEAAGMVSVLRFRRGSQLQRRGHILGHGVRIVAVIGILHTAQGDLGVGVQGATVCFGPFGRGAEQ
jgi:hypothetical protein